MFPDNICQNIDILAVINAQKINFGFHGNRKTQGHKHQLNNLYFKYQLCQMKLRHLNTFLQCRLLFNEPYCTGDIGLNENWTAGVKLAVGLIAPLEHVKGVFLGVRAQTFVV